MLNSNDHLVSQAMARTVHQQRDEEREAMRSALKLYDRACNRGRLCKLWSLLTRRTNRLVDLSQLEADCTVHARCYEGIKTVPLQQIRGSSGRCYDFDPAFHPQQSHNKGRWLNIAVARQMGTTLPPVALVRVEDVYFVTDGHHRISVARALGQACIEAEVVAWQVAAPLPWQRPTQTRRHKRARTRQSIWPLATN